MIIDHAIMRMQALKDTACRILCDERPALLALRVVQLGLRNSVSLAEKFDALIAVEPGQTMLSPIVQIVPITQLMPQDGSAMRATIAWYAMHDANHWILIGVMSAAS